MDSVMANADAGGDFERAVEIELNELKKSLATMQFVSGRETGYADRRSNQDLVEDTTFQNTDQEYIQKYAYLKDQRPELQGALGYNRNGGTFADGVTTEQMRESDAYEAATRMLNDAEGGSAQLQAQLISELSETYPEMFKHDASKVGTSPAMRLAQAYSDSMNKNTLAGQRKERAKRQTTPRSQIFF